MRSSIALASLLAASVLAKPLGHKKYHDKRDIVYETDYEVVYTYVYVTEGVEAPAASSTSTTAAPTSISVQTAGQPGFFGRHRHSKPTSSAVQITTTAQPDPVNSAVVVTVTEGPAPTTAVATTAAPPATSPTTAAASTPTVASTYEDILLLHHNIHRANHSAPELTWSNKLASIAHDEALVCVYAHNTTGGGGGYGQNIGAGIIPDNVSAMITTMMYNGEMTWYAGQYGKDSPSFDNFEHWGHFTQIVWKETTEVGCATVHCDGGLGNVGSNVAPYFTVCNYSPAGNMGGQYAENVGEPLGHASVQADYGM